MSIFGKGINIINIMKFTFPYCLYLVTDLNDFLTNSGWFTYSGKPLGSEALLYVLAKKCGMDYDEFMQIKKAVYMFAFGNEEKVFIGMYLQGWRK